ncbi:MAG: multicopper oxidase domain-containing protein [Anaerolineae bacterium]|nr:multicopper oxidase domain-containing protein [Anaerolineae bacterium]
MIGNLVVVDGSVDEAPSEAISIVRNPADVPEPIGDREATTVRVELTTQEVVGQLADGTTMTYWTFNGQVPGPLIRVRVGDVVEVTVIICIVKYRQIISFVRCNPQWTHGNALYPIGKSVWDYFANDVRRTIDVGIDDLPITGSK